MQGHALAAIQKGFVCYCAMISTLYSHFYLFASSNQQEDEIMNCKLPEDFHAVLQIENAAERFDEALQVAEKISAAGVELYPYMGPCGDLYGPALPRCRTSENNGPILRVGTPNATPHLSMNRIISTCHRVCPLDIPPSHAAGFTMSQWFIPLTNPRSIRCLSRATAIPLSTT